jgi:hypothetical protein
MTEGLIGLQKSTNYENLTLIGSGEWLSRFSKLSQATAIAYEYVFPLED